MRRLRNRTECALCGVTLAGITTSSKVQRVLVGASGHENVRVILVNGKEVHRCNAMGRS